MKQSKEIIRLAFPSMMENLLQMLMGVVDNYLVAQVGLVAVSGVSVANNIITIYQAVFIALGAAISSLVAKSIGEKNAQKTVQYQSDALLITIVLSLFLGLISVTLGKQILQLLGTATAVTQTGGLYLALVGGLIISLGLITTFGAILRSTGKPRLPMYVSLVANILNALFSAVAVFICHWGVAGVACSTVLARFISVGILAYYLPIKRMVKHMRWRLSDDLIKLALPAAGERLMMRAGDVVIIAIIVKFGTKVVAGNAIGETLIQFNFMPGFGVATATVILVARCLGQRNPQAIRRLVRMSYVISVLPMFAIGLFSWYFHTELSQLFTTDSVALQASATVLFYSFIGGPATAGTLIYTATWQGLGNARLPFYATTIGMWLIRIVLGYVLGITFNLGLQGVWLATLADNIFRWFLLKFLYHRHLKTLEPAPAT